MHLGSSPRLANECVIFCWKLEYGGNHVTKKKKTSQKTADPKNKGSKRGQEFVVKAFINQNGAPRMNFCFGTDRYSSKGRKGS